MWLPSHQLGRTEMFMTQENKEVMSDEAIIELYWQRNERALSETDKKYKKYLYNIALYDSERFDHQYNGSHKEQRHLQWWCGLRDI